MTATTASVSQYLLSPKESDSITLMKSSKHWTTAKHGVMDYLLKVQSRDTEITKNKCQYSSF